MTKISLAFATFIVTLLASALNAFAQSSDQEVTMLSLLLKNGKTDQYYLLDSPLVSFDKNRMIITSKSLKTEYLTAEVKRFTFDKKQIESSKIEDIKISPSQEMIMSFSKDCILSIKASNLQYIAISDIQGKPVKTVTAPENFIETDLSSLPSGVYIITLSNHKSFRILK